MSTTQNNKAQVACIHVKLPLATWSHMRPQTDVGAPHSLPADATCSTSPYTLTQERYRDSRACFGALTMLASGVIGAIREHRLRPMGTGAWSLPEFLGLMR